MNSILHASIERLWPCLVCSSLPISDLLIEYCIGEVLLQFDGNVGVMDVFTEEQLPRQKNSCPSYRNSEGTSWGKAKRTA
jgi:hypothetical protein